MKDKRIGVLLGGLSAEREISLRTGEAMFGALKRRGYDVVKVYVDGDLDQVLRQNPIDLAVIALHGTYGEDGCVQGLLELLGIPYTGSSVLASALAFDKLKSKELFRLHNVPTPPYYVLEADQLDRLEEIHGSFGFPAFVKPRRSGSSVGAGRANDPVQLRERCEDAAQFDPSILIERFVTGREVAVGVLDGRALGAVEIVPRGRFYDYKSKYQKGQSEYHFPARLSPTRYKGVLNIAERAARSLGVSGAARVDLLVTEGENEYVLEVNTLPGLTETSLLPMIARGAGYDFDDLVEAIVARAGLGMRPSLPSAPATAQAAARVALADAE
ncbi:MAG TPA: D-alanine--D-alanine ligase [Polyangiaceae bacterium LLY-WYZ-15_(1-7)]|nr:D-alanine--D-alanine ligase [Polyangiaceae bacterium LLY-WYZ-15_(1-7)]HJL06181.1 D-alanine--D-alanine ligase [Polyangiaceae bacterium LLY-WYZ-15_(1-7)]HJL11770.1 D-alanine--D-alanine ligase [Polyangiaceae bacterium LLY-WYZ-15_(1-7)]HJL32031.1 D-alanine--D-alanine ligase [Polyangiaceae bacterium LLY-WYZ-15_(1-7)]HJL39566.1 D-alanine--D-alanine ligase [Polyangiaceae bacterium LLY-WYZ-15_(1-7)]